MCEIESQWEFVVWLRELKLGLCDTLEGWDGAGGGREVQEGGDGYMYTYGWFRLWFGRNQYNSVKQLSFSKKVNLKLKKEVGLEGAADTILNYLQRPRVERKYFHTLNRIFE